MKITPQILLAVRRAVDYYGNTSQVAKAMGIAHSTVFFWLKGKTVSMSGKLWQTKIRPVLAPFLPGEQGNGNVKYSCQTGSASGPLILHEDAGVYQTMNGKGLFAGYPPGIETPDTAKAEGLPVIPYSALTQFDPSAGSVRSFLKQHSTEKLDWSGCTMDSFFAVRLDNEFSGVFLPGTDLLISTVDFPEDQSIVIARLRESGEVIMGKYTRSGSRITILSLLQNGKEISWDCSASLGYTLWCFHVLEAKLDLRNI